MTILECFVVAFMIAVAGLHLLYHHDKNKGEGIGPGKLNHVTSIAMNTQVKTQHFCDSAR